MQDIPMQTPSPDFIDCWKAAGTHLDRQVQGGIGHWLKATPTPPFLEHLSFRLGNQLFFVRVEDLDGGVEAPGSLAGLHTVAEGCNGHPCRLPMRRAASGWQAVHGGWGLIDAHSGRPVDPFALVTDERVPMTPWEMQDFAVQVVRDHLKNRGFEVMSSQGNPGVDPAIWFVGESGGPEWVVVRAAPYPASRAEPPGNLAQIAEACARTGSVGHFASVAMVCVDALFDDSDDEDDLDITENANPLPLWRGHGMDVAFEGLEPVTAPDRKA